MSKNETPQPIQAYTTGLLQGTAYSRLHTRLSRALLPFGVSIPEWKLLGQVQENGEIKLSFLADILSYDPPMVTKLIKQLEKKKMVKRQQDKHDERAKIIFNTPLGNAVVLQAEPEVKKAMNQILHGITKDELMIYIKVLTAIVKNTE